MMYVPAEVMSASLLAASHSTAPGQSSTSYRVPYSFELLIESRVQLQLQETLSWHWMRGVQRLLPLKPMLNDYSRYVVI